MRNLLWLLCLCTAQVWCQSTTSTPMSVSTISSSTTTIRPTTAAPPPDVTHVNVLTRSETQLELQWTKVNSDTKYDYILRYSNGTETTITGSDAGTTVTHTVSSLSPGTNYSFTLYTVFDGVKSTGFNFSVVTTPSNVAHVNVLTRSETHLELQWTKVNSNNNYDYTLRYSNGTETNITGSVTGTTVTHTVSSLSPGTNYSFTLYTVFDGVKSTGFKFSVVTTPSNVAHVNVLTRSETHLELQWTKVNSNNNYDYTLRYSNGTETNITGSDAGTTVTHTVSSLSPGTEYSFTLYTVFDGVKSTGFKFSVVTTPSNVAHVNVLTRSETHLELQWYKVNNDIKYDYILRYNGTETNITGSDAGTTVTHTVSSLSPGTNYFFTLYTVFDGVKSTGFNFSVVTTPSNVAHVNVLTRSETHLELQWCKVNNDIKYDYILRYNGTDTNITGSDAGTTVTHTVSSLSPGTNYFFTLYTVFDGVKSTGFNFLVVTTPSNVAHVNVLTRSETHLKLQWDKVNNNNNYDYILRDNNRTETNITGSDARTKVTHTVSSLLPGTEYKFILFTVFEGVRSTGLQFSDITTPAPVINLNCVPGDYSIKLRWEKPLGVVTGVEVSVSGKDSNSVSGTENIVTGLQPAKTYSISVTSLSGTMRSSPIEIKCQTHSTVIWVPVLVIILLGLLAAVGVFVLRRKPKLLNKIPIPMYERHTETDSSQDKFKAISKQKFPDHFHHLSRDENRELTMEYMQFSSVGADLTQREATLAENKSKNRFIDILPYDCSRVKLSTHGHDSDYINANYIPGYGGKNMDYIAAQGPLPSTVSDFWRMIWDQKTERIVMVTNCVENGKTKCEQYWPQSNVSCRHGDLHITTKSERTDTNWTIREFLVKNEKAKSEVRFVKHFHFTAWPDHGVPAGTETLIQFRRLIRDHIIKSQTSGPTVIHCSAGVGRTGTLIALDVLLQQLEREQAVDIAGFVYRMRRHRPRMVQTESQYIFLHQCIKDCLTEEPLYANVKPSLDLIYENTMAMGLE